MLLKIISREKSIAYVPIVNVESIMPSKNVTLLSVTPETIITMVNGKKFIDYRDINEFLNFLNEPANEVNIFDSIMDVYSDESLLIADGFNEAIIGVDSSSMRFIYSVSKCIDILSRGALSVEDALEYFDHNVRGFYVGDKTPIWCDDIF